MEKSLYLKLSIQLYEKLKYKSYCSSKSIAEITRLALENYLEKE